LPPVAPAVIQIKPLSRFLHQTAATVSWSECCRGFLVRTLQRFPGQNAVAVFSFNRFRGKPHREYP
jgi:hypothetical protein